MRLISEGEILPRFYLPCRELDYARKIECYPILYAPIVLLLYFVYDVSIYAWFDLFRYHRMLRKYKAKSLGDE